MKNLARVSNVLLLLCLPFALLACGDDEEVAASQPTQDAVTDLGADVESDVLSDDVPEADFVVQDPCAELEEGDECDDGNACTADDSCSSGVCSGGVNVTCEGGGPCRDAVCDPANGCTYTDMEDGSECSLGCFGVANCAAGECEADPESAVACPESDDPCVVKLSCDSATGECTVPIYEVEGAACDTDENVCGLEACDDSGVCVDLEETENCSSENDSNACWTYVCSPKDGCIKTNFVDGGSCDDLNPCTYTDICTDNEFGQKTCLGTPVQVEDGNPCTDDSCVDGTVMHTPIDGASCTTEEPCVQVGVCQEDTCTFTDDSCGCETMADCDQPDDLCSGQVVCEIVDGVGQCVLDDATAVTCVDDPNDCWVHLCDSLSGECLAKTMKDGAGCSLGPGACAEEGMCQDGTCWQLQECPKEEAIYIIDGIDSVVRRSFDDGDTWAVFGDAPPIPPPSMVAMARTEGGTLYVSAYINEGNAVDMGLSKGNHVYRSDDDGATWVHASSWDSGSSAPALCGSASMLYGTDAFGNVYRSSDLGVTMPKVGQWDALGGKSACAVSPSGGVLFIDSVYCGSLVEDGCAAAWWSNDMGATAVPVGNYAVDGGGIKAAVAVDDDGVFYALAGEGNIYASFNDGVTWAMVGAVPSLKSINTIAASSKGVLYAATAPSGCVDCDDGTMSGEFFVSKDGGSSWGKSASDWTPGGSGSGWVAMVTAYVTPE